MRITADQKAATRQRILDVAVQQFKRAGYEATTTRDVAKAAEIATGTLFNYFPTKESIVQALVESAASRARAAQGKISTSDLEEALFALIAAELRQLKPHRRYVSAILDTSLSPLRAGEPSTDGQRFRTDHLELVVEVVRRHGEPELTPTSLQLYWTLYMGVLAYWAADRSRRQESTLALLDESMAMFVGWLQTHKETH